MKYVTLDDKTSHKGQFVQIEMYTFLYFWKLNKISIFYFLLG